MRLIVTHRRVVGLGVAVLLVTTTACGQFAVPPPFDQTERGWEVEVGRTVRIVTREGAEIRGKVEAVDDTGFMVSGTRVARDDIREMWMEKENPTGPVLSVLAFGVVAVGAFWLFVLRPFGEITLDPD